MEKTSLAKKLLIVGICMMLLFSACAFFVNTNGGKVNVQEISFVTDFGSLSGLLYKPVGASSTSKKPAVVLSHGYLNTREMQDQAAIELSKRGMVVFAMDAYGHGHSTFNVSTDGSVFALLGFNAGGMWDAVNYLYELSYVNPAKIAVSGHSLGGMFSNAAVGYDNAAMKEGAPQKIASVLLAGAEPDYTEGYYGNRSVGVIAATWDEFFFFDDPTKTADYLNSDRAIKFVNDSTPGAIVAGDGVKNGLDYLRAPGYGVKGGFRAIYQPAEIHPWNHFSITSAKAYINFFGTDPVMSAYSLASLKNAENSQTWWAKEAFNGLALAGFFMSIFAAVSLLLKVPALANLSGGVGANGTKPSNKASKLVYWVGFSVSILLSGVLFLLIGTWIGDIEGGMQGLSMAYNSFFTQPVTNELIGWAVASAIVGLGIYIGSFFLNKKYADKTVAEGETSAPVTFKQLMVNTGVADKWTTIVKSLFVALGVVVGAYTMVFITQWLFQVDFRLWVVAIKTFELGTIVTALTYAPFFAIFFVVSSFVTNNAIAVKGRKEIYNYLLIIASVVGGVFLITFIQYSGLLVFGHRPFYTQNLRPLLGFSLVPLLAIASCISRFCYNKTGKIWLGAFINTLLITMLTVANTVTLYA